MALCIAICLPQKLRLVKRLFFAAHPRRLVFRVGDVAGNYLRALFRLSISLLSRAEKSPILTFGSIVTFTAL